MTDLENNLHEQGAVEDPNKKEVAQEVEQNPTKEKSDSVNITLSAMC